MQNDEAYKAQLEAVSEAPQSDDWPMKAMRADRLLVRMNHEIRTAMNVVLGMTDVVIEAEASSNSCNNVRGVRTTVERLLRESTAILDLGRAELGCLKLRSTSFKFNETVQRVVDVLSILAAAKNIALKVIFSRKIPLAVMGDPGRLVQIMTTLLRNRIDRIERGEISVTVEPESNCNDGNKIAFRIADNGPRIPPEVAGQMFEGVLRQDATVQGGFEPGLALARSLARLMGGDLWAETEPQTGMVFHFNVNLSPAPMVDFLRLYALDSQVSMDGRPLKLLVAEDSADTLLLIRAYLKDVPWGIESATDGRTALEMAVANSYDLILMDLDLPEMDGYIATRQIRLAERLKQMPAVPIVALTAHNETEAASRSIEAGCTAHVTKPIRKAGLIDVVRRYAGDTCDGGTQKALFRLIHDS